MEQLINWLFEQGSIAIIMGVVIFYLYKENKRLKDESKEIQKEQNNEKTELVEKIIDLTEKSTELATLQVEKTTQLHESTKQEHDVIIKLLTRLKDLIGDVRTDINRLKRHE